MSFMVYLACQPSSFSTSFVAAYKESMSPVLLPTISYGIFFPVAPSNAYGKCDDLSENCSPSFEVKVAREIAETAKFQSDNIP